MAALNELGYPGGITANLSLHLVGLISSLEVVLDALKQKPPARWCSEGTAARLYSPGCHGSPVHQEHAG